MRSTKTFLGMALGCSLLAQGHATRAGGSELPITGEVVWTTPSVDAKGSMPIGNGDIGANVWVEENGDLRFYLSKTDSWCGIGRLLKLGRVRVTLDPNPLKEGTFFAQALDIEQGEILIRFQNDEDVTSIRFVVDANHPVVTVRIDSSRPVSATAASEPWRTERRELRGQERHSAYWMRSGLFVEPDVIVGGHEDRVVWYHRNEDSIWRANLELQALGERADHLADPLLNRTSGAVITGAGMVNASDTTLKSSRPSKIHHIDIYPLTAQTETAEQWRQQVEAKAARLGTLCREERLAAHRAWWKAFWQRSHIRVSTRNERDQQRVANVNRGYRLQRFKNAAAGRGAYPIKFNGSIFTVGGTDQGAWDADYRRWGGPYWFQNTRLIYWPMLAAGDYDLMMPFFRLYLDTLDIRKAATRTYYDHDGAFFPETMTFWGTYTDQNYGSNRTNRPDGWTENTYIRYYWQGGLELSLMMLDYHAFTGDRVFAQDMMLPLVTEVLTFFDQHWPRDENGKIRFDPAMALETYREAVNPIVEIVAIRKVCEEMLALPPSLLTPQQREQYQRLISELPPIPMREHNGERLLASAESYSGMQNSENPELYVVFPYRRYGIGKPDLELAVRTFNARRVKRTGCWHQDAIQAAHLGLTDQAANFMSRNFSSSNARHRFPAMWGHGNDWTPDQDHGGVAMTALQRMLLHYDGDRMYLLPAWPKDWDVDFKLHAPGPTLIEGHVRDGEFVDLRITPERRKQDVTY